MKNLVILAIFSLFGVSTAYGKKVDIAPILSHQFQNGLMHAFFRIPCGAQFQGVVVNPKRDKLEVGIAYEKQDTPCANFPEIQQVSINWINPALNSQVTPMISTGSKFGWKMRKIHIISDLGKDKRGRAKAIYTSKCGKNPVVMIQNTEAQRLGVTIIESPTKKSYSNSCPFTEASLVIENIFPKNTAFSLSKLDLEAKSLAEAFALRIVPTKILKQSNEGALRVRYKRKCNEAPIGIVADDIKQQKNTDTLKVGFLVAYYYNKSCESNSKRHLTEVYQLPNFKLKHKTKIYALSPELVKGSLMLRSPSIKTTGKQGLRLSYESACNRKIGAVYSNDKNGHTNVGVLEKEKRGSCNQLLKRVSLNQSFMNNHEQKKNYYPLRIRGS